MHILLTGVCGEVGQAQFLYLLEQGHTVLATDVVPLLPAIRSAVETTHAGKWTFSQLDLRDASAIDALLDSAAPPVQGVIHYGAISTPLGANFRVVHNNNVVGSYNMLEACASRGIHKVVQASSVNAPGLGYCADGHITHDRLPIDETCAMRPVSWAIAAAGDNAETRLGGPVLSIQDVRPGLRAYRAELIRRRICEIQAAALCRYYPGLRVASLRFHMVKPSHAMVMFSRAGRDSSGGFWAWSNMRSCCRAAELGLLSSGWQGHEAFYIIADTILTTDELREQGSLELLVKSWDPLRYGVVDRAWWAKERRRGFWDCSKAERLLGWKHEEQEAEGDTTGRD